MAWHVLHIIVAFILAGCTSYWSDPGQWQAQFSTDAAFCEAQARQATGSGGQAEDSQQTYQRCMAMRGWPQSPAPR